jgi:cation diffusion facilitator family transporter
MSQSAKQEGNAVVNLGLGANVLLAALKTSIGVLGHSPALLADGINSTSDVAYYIVVKIFMRLAGKPADREHPYGHSQLETISALVVGAFIVATAVAIFWDAINKVYDYFTGASTYGGAEISALWVALFTVVLKIVLTVVTRRVGERTKHVAIMALASDHRNDIFSAIGAAVGITFGRMGFPFVDPLVGGLVAFMVLRTGIQILRDTSADLMDTVPGEQLDQQVRDILKSVPDVQIVEEVHAHRFGPYLVLNLQIGIDGNLSVFQGDAIASQVETAVCKEIKMVAKAYVHYHPGRPTALSP